MKTLLELKNELRQLHKEGNIEGVKLLRDKIQQLEQREYLQGVKDKVNEHNANVKEINKCLHFLNTLDSNINIFKKDGFYTKKFDTLIKELNNKLSGYLYIKCYSYSKLLDITFRANNVNYNIYLKGGVYTCNANVLDFNTVIEQQKKHNKLLAQIEVLQSELNSNYIDCNYHINVGMGKNYPFNIK